MPLRLPASREQTWLLPPTLDELVPADHPARFVGACVDALQRAAWVELGVGPDGDAQGAPAYHPRVLLSVWLYGFMTGVRSSRKLEGACRDQLPYLWLTGWQHPDHNTLWRFYQAHRAGLRKLLKRTVGTAVGVGLIELAVQAVDGTKVAGNAAKERTYDAPGLQRLLERTEAAIADLEAQNTTGGDPPPPRLPEQLAEAKALQEQVQAAMARLSAEEGRKEINLTDPGARLMKGRQGFVAGYNAQAMVSPLVPKAAGATGLFITATEVSDCPADQAQLLPMIEQAQENAGRAAAVTLADGGYHSGPNLVACAEGEHTVVMAESHQRATEKPDPYRNDAFHYQEEADTYRCPQGQTLRFAGEKHAKGRPVSRVYRASRRACLACPAFGVCTKDRRHGRMLQIGPQDRALRAHRAWMATEEAKARYRQRKLLPEPTFGILKEQQGARRFWLRGIAAVQAEWALLATAFNLRTLHRLWRDWAAGRPGRGMLTGALA